MYRKHPVFQVYIPDSLISEIKRLERISNCKEIECVQLVGLWERSPLPDQDQNDQTTSKNANASNFLRWDKHKEKTGNDDSQLNPGYVIVTLVGIIVKRREVNPEETVTQLSDDIVGEILFGKRQQGFFAAQSIDLPSIWLTLRVGVAYSPHVTIEQICLDNMMLFPDPHSVILLQFNPRSLHDVYRLGLNNSGLPDIVVKGFAYKIPHEIFRFNQSKSNGDYFIPFLPPSNSEQLDPGGQFDDGYLQKFNNEEDFKSRILKRCMGIKQILYKLHLMSKVFKGKVSGLALANLLVLMMIDVFLGLMFTYYLLQFHHLYSTLHSKVEELLRILMQLLNWLRGSPAGLKLNAALNSLLWRFFSYHLHLWANYIGILEPILSFLLSVIINIGPLGLTVQISLIKDLVSMATFHVYCLYIYATRLFSVQLVAIKSLGRLFLGRKWNPLRNRVDHVNLSKSEMFLSALAFTIGLFLAPTTIIYYAVFLSLRLPVLIVESFLVYLIEVLNCSQIVTNFLIFINSSRVSDEIYLKHVPTSPMLTFRICLQSTKNILVLPKIGRAILITLQHIFQGKVLNR